ncbi:MAG: S8 family serine peptidase [Candidatus Omnitrophota bacterium]
MRLKTAVTGSLFQAILGVLFLSCFVSFVKADPAEVAGGSLFAAPAAQSGAPSFQAGRAARYQEGEVLVKFKDGVEPQGALNACGISIAGLTRIHAIAPVVAKYKETRLRKNSNGWYSFMGANYKEVAAISDEDVFRQAYQTMEPREQAIFRAYRARLPQDMPVAEAVKNLENDPAVEYAEPNYKITFDAAPLPNDPLLKTVGSWGQSYADLWPLTKIQCPDAWQLFAKNGRPGYEFAGDGVVVAVIDTGVDYYHTELSDNIWVNPALIQSGVIRDTNGDGTVNIYDLDANRDKTITAATELPDNAIGHNFADNNSDPYDLGDHGTNVAGIIAAKGNNGVGGIGVAPKAKIMCVKIASSDDPSSSVISNGAPAIRYAADNGAQVANASWSMPGVSKTLIDAVSYADWKGCLVVVAAGNEGYDLAAEAPCNVDGALTVVASTQNDELYGSSNYGLGASVSAPGGGYPTDLPSGDIQNNNNIVTLKSHMSASRTWNASPGFERACGTSVAAPFAAGVAALIKCRYPNDVPQTIRARMMAGCDPIDALNPANAGLMGTGRVNAYKALTVTPQPLLKLIQVKADGIATGRQGTMVVSVKNFWLGITGVTATLQTTDPNVTIPNGTASLGAIDQYAVKDNASAPFTVLIGAGVADGATVRLDVVLTGDNGYRTVCPIVYQNSYFKSAGNESALPMVGAHPVYSLFRDLDGDGLPDVLFIDWNGTGNTKFYRNTGTGSFTDVPLPDLKYTEAPLFLDIDNDGKEELFIDNVNFPLTGASQRHCLFRYDPSVGFTDITNGSGLNASSGSGTERTFSAVPIDYNNDGFIDICTDSMIFRNNGDTTFTRIGLGSVGLRALSTNPTSTNYAPIIAFDYNNDGFQDLLFPLPALFRNNGDGTFTDVTIAAGLSTAVATDPVVQTQGIAVGDYDCDGSQDIFWSYADKSGVQHNVLLKNTGSGKFVDVTATAGDIKLCASSAGMNWGCEFFDYDNDGDLDLIVPQTANGQKSRVLRNNGNGTFTDVTDSLVPKGLTLDGAPVSVADFNNDGALDIYAPSATGASNAACGLLKNMVGRRNNWIKIKLVGWKSGSGTDAYGTKVFVRTGTKRQLLEVRFSPMNSQPLHFGLGQAAMVDEIEVRWPRGGVKKLTNINVNQVLTITEDNPPVLDRTSVQDQTVAAGQKVVFALKASDPDNEPLTYAVYYSADVNRSGTVTPSDALQIINIINLNIKPGDSDWMPEADVNGSGAVTALDDLLVINQLNAGMTTLPFTPNPSFASTGALSWQTSSSQAGEYYLALVVSDGKMSDFKVAKVTVVGAPVITALSPASGLPNVTVTINGTNLTNITKITFRNRATGVSTDIPQINVGAGLSCQIAALAPGNYDVTVTSLGGTSNAVAFTVLGGLPAVGDLKNPPAGAEGEAGSPPVTSFTGKPGRYTPITATYIDPYGPDALASAYISIWTSTAPSGGAYYSVADNKLYLDNGSNTGWLGGFAPGSANKISNLYFTLDCQTTMVSKVGTTLAVTWSISPRSAAVGTITIYLRAIDKANVTTDWVRKGTIIVSPNTYPSNGTITPTSGTARVGIPFILTASYLDSDGNDDIAEVGSLIYSPYVWVKYSTMDNKLYISNETASGWIGGFVPGSANLISNAYGTLDCSRTTISRTNSATITVTWCIIPKAGFTGSKGIYSRMVDKAGADTGFVYKGSRTVTQ